MIIEETTGGSEIESITTLTREYSFDSDWTDTFIGGEAGLFTSVQDASDAFAMLYNGLDIDGNTVSNFTQYLLTRSTIILHRPSQFAPFPPLTYILNVDYTVYIANETFDPATITPTELDALDKAEIGTGLRRIEATVLDHFNFGNQTRDNETDLIYGTSINFGVIIKYHGANPDENTRVSVTASNNRILI